jgi:glycosyltransferase involved in cell wall biosynthesis
MGTTLITHLHVSVDLSKYTEKLPFKFDFKAALKERFLAQTYFLENKYVTKKADLIIACDNYTKNSVLRYYNKKVEVVYNGVDYDKFKRVNSDLKERYGADYLLMDIARPVPWKGAQYLLRALKELNEEHNIYCLLIGMKRGDHDVGYRWLNSIAKKLELSNVEFLPRIPYYDLPKYYSACDCFVTPSYPDPSPKTVYEAQACNTPVAATNGGGIPEIFGEESGLLFKPKDVKDMVEKIKIILENPKRFRGGRKVIKDKATWKKCVDDMVKIYEKYV